MSKRRQNESKGNKKRQQRLSEFKLSKKIKDNNKKLLIERMLNKINFDDELGYN